MNNVHLPKFLLAALATTMVTMNCWSAEKIIFPYGSPVKEIQIILKSYKPASARTTVFTIQAGGIQGEADLVSAPTANVGRLIIDANASTLKSTVENMHAPYGGEITSTIECRARKYVKDRDISFPGLDSKLILAVATSRKIFGVCALEEIGNVAVYFTAYDKKRKQVLTVQLFKPITDLKKIDEFQEEIFKLLQKIILNS